MTTGCNCQARDPWRCAVIRGLTTVACHCACHQDRVAIFDSQLELTLRDWRPMSSAPRNATWVEVEKKDHVIVRAHFAQDLSGEYQPSFSGWYVDAGSYFDFVHPSPIRWRPE